MRIAFGRRARLYVSDVGFDDEGLVLVRRAKDITLTDEADDLVAEARDLPYKVHNQGAKEISLEFERLIDADDDGDDVTLLHDAYVNATELFVLATRLPKEQASGLGIRFKALVFGWPEEFPEGEAAKGSFTLRLVDVDQPPERVDTPYTTEDMLGFGDGDSLGFTGGDKFAFTG